MEGPPSIAIGRLGEAGRWIGLRRAGAGYELVTGGGDAVVAAAPATADDVLALAHAYFSETLDSPPASLEATHADVAAAVRWVVDAADARDPERRRRLADALDAIDDGLALDEVLARLALTMPAEIGEDVGAYLVGRATRLQLTGRA